MTYLSAECEGLTHLRLGADAQQLPSIFDDIEVLLLTVKLLPGATSMVILHFRMQ